MATNFTRRASRTAALFAAAALVAGSLSPAYAAARDPNGAAPAAAVAKPQTAKKERKFCVETELTGTRITRKTCKTRDQWIKENDFDPTEDARR